MIASKLPPTSVLYKFLQKCKITHSLVMQELHDGALVMECGVCNRGYGWHHVLLPDEEAIIRKEMSNRYHG